MPRRDMHDRINDELRRKAKATHDARIAPDLSIHIETAKTHDFDIVKEPGKVLARANVSLKEAEKLLLIQALHRGLDKAKSQKKVRQWLNNQYKPEIEKMQK